MAMKYGAGHMMRKADFLVVKQMGGSPDKVRNLVDTFLPALADYLWDHIMGEPDDPSTEEVLEFVVYVRDLIYSLDETTRNAVESIIEPDEDASRN
jgi:hypothetical protein